MSRARERRYTMNENGRFGLVGAGLALLLALATPAAAAVTVQCPGDTNGDGVWTGGEVQPPNTVCMHLAAGDGFARMGDGTVLYTFGFHDITGTAPDQAVAAGMLAAEFSAPTIKIREGQNLYLTLTNVGMVMRPDLFDPHSVHFHGYPNASAIFDGEPMSTISVDMGASLTYYYLAPTPGTYMYHCHVEATEHMQMGMLGNLYVTPLQDGTTVGGCASQKYVYNDGDGSTCYDVDYPIQISGFDRNFHELHLGIQPLPFALMVDDYPMLNGRGYPDTIDPLPLTPPAENGGLESQKVSSLITATAGDKILLRISSLSTVDYFTLSVLGIPMKVVGKDSRLLTGPAGSLPYTTSSVTLGGGETMDVILDTAGIAAGTYFLYTTNLNFLSNGPEDFGGMMTEIVIN
jgi:FtsP/CotA-like multicopper oxidase with cupredoxin domain